MRAPPSGEACLTYQGKRQRVESGWNSTFPLRWKVKVPWISQRSPWGETDSQTLTSFLIGLGFWFSHIFTFTSMLHARHLKRLYRCRRPCFEFHCGQLLCCGRNGGPPTLAEMPVGWNLQMGLSGNEKETPPNCHDDEDKWSTKTIGFWGIPIFFE